MARKLKYKKRIKVNYLTQSEIMSKYGFTRSMIERFLPEPIYKKNPMYSNASPIKLYRESDVISLLSKNKKLNEVLKKKAAKKATRERKIKEKANLADEFLKSFSPEDLILEGKKLNRHFILHVGPTNSGKTYEGIEALKKAKSGLYLGPLRLLALEMFETLNSANVRCNLLTGEEYEEVPDATITSSTIELCNFDESYDTCVIDEAQLISDPFRGAAWTSAICLLNSKVIHICMAPEAENLIVKLIEKMESTYEIRRHNRLVPLEFFGKFNDLSEVEDGDCLIAFSRKKVLSISASLEDIGIKSSVIYGALPPKARREETRKFAEKVTKVVVATDAIGMGISLPIKRIIFVDTEKFDGVESRPLLISEIKQIAGRAGRFGKYDLGEVLTMKNGSLIELGLLENVPLIEKIHISFPKEALSYDYPLDKLLHQWNELPPGDIYSRKDMSEAEFLLKKLGKFSKNIDKELLYDFITCPIDIKNDKLVSYWFDTCISIVLGTEISKPNFPEDTLENCELKYQAYDVYHQLLRKINIEDNCLLEKEILCNKINKFLLESKKGYIRKCRICGRILPLTSKYGICDKCFNKRKY